MPRANRFPSCFLVVASSARLLAQSAARAGHPVCALDLFNDADTARFALRAASVDARAGQAAGFDGDDVIRQATRMCPPSRCLGLVYGAGFEDDTGTLGRLAQGRELIGNPPELVARMKHPLEFFGLLDRLGIPHPETALEPPARPRGWLYKRRGASGGAHVTDAPPADRAPGAGYFQRRAPGRSLSALFLADGRRARVVGISRQLTRGVAHRRYEYAGAVGPVPVPDAAWRALHQALQRLVAHTGLIGCNSLDFMLAGERLAVLEINPRPSATMDLYDAGWPGGLFNAHVLACRGRLPGAALGRRPSQVRAHAIVYAGAALRIAADAAFPPWCSDVPQAGCTVAADAPVCTVHAAGADAPRALRQLRRRRRRIESGLAGRLDWEETENACKNKHKPPEREPRRHAAGRVAAAAA